MKRGTWTIILLFLAFDAAVISWWLLTSRHDHDAIIRAAAAHYEMDPALIKAVVWRESTFNADARGTSGELGLMQIREAAANEWARAEEIPNFHHGHLVDAKSNVLAGTWYLKKWMNRAPHTNNPLPFALAAYNAGPGKARQWAKDTNSSEQFVEQIDYPATKDYVLTVQKKAAEYRASQSGD